MHRERVSWISATRNLRNQEGRSIAIVFEVRKNPYVEVGEDVPTYMLALSFSLLVTGLEVCQMQWGMCSFRKT